MAFGPGSQITAVKELDWHTVGRLRSPSLVQVKLITITVAYYQHQRGCARASTPLQLRNQAEDVAHISASGVAAAVDHVADHHLGAGDIGSARASTAGEHSQDTNS